MKIRILTLLLILGILGAFPPALGLTNIPNANTTDDYIYSNYTAIDTKYILNPSDSVFYVELYHTYKKYPYSIAYSFTDSKNNKLQIFTKYTMLDDGYIFDKIGVTISAKMNGAPVLLKGSFIKDTYEYNDSHTEMPIPLLEQSAGNDITFSGSLVEFFDHGQIKTLNLNFDRNYYFNNISIPNATADLYFKSIIIKYRDNGISSVKYEIDNKYHSLNPVFRLLFMIVKAGIIIVNGLTLGTVISDDDVISYQEYIITPLSYIDTLIGYAIAIVKFIVTMGLIWCLGLGTMIIFIYAYAISPDLMTAFSKFAEVEHLFLSVVIIRPALWLYDRLVIEIITRIRG